MGTVVLVGVTAGTAYRIARRAAKRRAATLARAAAGLLHDLKGPLTVVLANAELLAEAPADATQRQASLRDVHGKAHGTGLGMTVVRDVARRSGGTVSCRSAPGQGTEVTLTLPCPGVGTCGVPN
jgi:signal transduction histidine kinase